MHVYKKPGSSKWWVAWRDARERRQRNPGYTDKASTEALGRNLELMAGKVATGSPMTPALVTWLDGLTPAWRDRLVKAKLLSVEAGAISKPLLTHVEDYKESRETKGCREQYVGDVDTHLRNVVKACRFKVWADIDKLAIESYLSGRLRDPEAHFKSRTANCYINSWRAFCRWMVMQDRASKSPVETLSKFAVNDDQKRGAFSVEDVIALLDYLDTGPPVSYGLTAPERSLLYHFAAVTAMRAGKIRSLTSTSFIFTRDDDHRPTGCTVKVLAASQSKYRKPQIIPLLDLDLVERLDDVVRMKGPGTPAIAVPYDPAQMLRADVAAAGLPLVDLDGYSYVFHSFRHTAATWLFSLGATTAQVQAITGHLDQGTLTRTYAHQRLEQAVTAMEAMPRLRRRKGVAS